MPRVSDHYAQTVYADALIEGLTPYDAALRAGFSSATAQSVTARLSVEPLVRTRLAEHHESVQRVSAWSADRVIRELASVAQEARAAEQYNVARQAYRDIGEHIGMWPKVAPNVDARSLNIDMSGLSTDELRAMLSGAMGQQDTSLYIEQDASSSTDAS